MKWRYLPHIRNWVPRLQAHRGFWVEGIQQNTLESIIKAEELKYQMVEFDVRLTKDLQVVLFHDEHLSGQKLSDLSYQNLLELAQSHHLKISTLEDVFIWFQNKKKSNAEFDFKLNIEIKSQFIFKNDLENLVYKLIEQYKMLNHVLISSFNPFSLFRFKKLNSNLVRALLLTEGSESNFILESMLFNFLCEPDLIHLRYEDFKKNKYHKLSQKIPLVLWTVNDLEFYESQKDFIHGVISDSITPKKLREKN